MLDITGFTLLIQVFDMPTSVAFYRDILGFQVDAQSEPGDNFDWCMLRRDRIVLMLNTAYEKDHRPQKLDLARAAVHDDTALFFDCPDPDAAYGYFCSGMVAVGKLPKERKVCKSPLRISSLCSRMAR